MTCGRPTTSARLKQTNQKQKLASDQIERPTTNKEKRACTKIKINTQDTKKRHAVVSWALDSTYSLRTVASGTHMRYCDDPEPCSNAGPTWAKSQQSRGLLRRFAPYSYMPFASRCACLPTIRFAHERLKHTKKGNRATDKGAGASTTVRLS